MLDITLGICGTAGGQEDGKRLTRKHFEAMYLVASGLLEEINKSNYKISTIVSTGLAWANHLAVKLFLDKKAPGLRLFIPAEWKDGAYYDSGVDDFKTNPGRTANYYHRKFQSVTGINGLSDIQIAKSYGAELYCCRGGFHGRNAMVAKSDFLLAMTFGNGPIVKAGGTEDTVRMYLDRVRKEDLFDKSFHYNLSDGKIYEGCQVPPKEKMINDAPKFLGKRPLPSYLRGLTSV